MVQVVDSVVRTSSSRYADLGADDHASTAWASAMAAARNAAARNSGTTSTVMNAAAASGTLARAPTPVGNGQPAPQPPWSPCGVAVSPGSTASGNAEGSPCGVKETQGAGSYGAGNPCAILASACEGNLGVGAACGLNLRGYAGNLTVGAVCGSREGLCGANATAGTACGENFTSCVVLGGGGGRAWRPGSCSEARRC
jgi:hypothetical protein